MRLHLLMTPEIEQAKPATTKVVHDFGTIVIVMEDGKRMYGLHCVVEDEEQNIIDWLKFFDGVPVGDGNPQMESFQIMHIKGEYHV